jgi:uncharacterized protein YbaR (Trm112 family)
MFIELADHLRCAADHEEQHLVLLPARIEERWVREGSLGCPVCGREYQIVDGVFDTGDGPADPPAPSALDTAAVSALTGLGGPGGYVLLVGGAATRWPALAEQIPDVAIVAMNPDPSVIDGPGVSVLRGTRPPIRSGSMRAVVLGPGYGDDEEWVSEAMRVTLAGLRIVGEGAEPVRQDLDIMAVAEGCWVGSKMRNRF